MTLSSHRIADIRWVRVELIDNYIDLVTPFTRAGLLLVLLHDFRVRRFDDGGDFIIKNFLILYAPIARFMNRFGLIIIGPIVRDDGTRFSMLNQLIRVDFIRVSAHAEPLMIDTLITGLGYISQRYKSWLNL